MCLDFVLECKQSFLFQIFVHEGLPTRVAFCFFIFLILFLFVVVNEVRFVCFAAHNQQCEH